MFSALQFNGNGRLLEEQSKSSAKTSENAASAKCQLCPLKRGYQKTLRRTNNLRATLKASANKRNKTL